MNKEIKMEDITHEKVLEVLDVIKQICIKSKKCNDCPFCNETDCMISSYTPYKWELEERITWKAFKEKD